MHNRNKNQNKGSLTIVNYADACRYMEQAKADAGDDVQMFYVFSFSRKDADPDPTWEEALASMGTFIKLVP